MLPRLPEPSKARPAESKAMAYTTSCELVHIRRGPPVTSIRYTSLPPVTPKGAVLRAGSGDACRGATWAPPTLSVIWDGTGAGAGTRCGLDGGARGWPAPRAAE